MTRIVRLGDLVRVTHGYAFDGAGFTGEATGNILITPGNFSIGGGFKLDKPKYFRGEVPERFVLKPGDLVVTMTDLSKSMDTLGCVAIIPELTEGARALHNQRVGKFELISDEVDREWLGYRLRGHDYLAEVRASSSGSTVHHTSPGRIEQFEFDLPPLTDQRAIAATLGALDDKIESNRRTLGISQSIGDQYFQRASKIEVPLAEVAEVIMGSSPPGETYNGAGDGTAFFQGTRDFGFRFPKSRVWTSGPLRIAERNSTLISVRAPVGELNRAGEECCIGRGVASAISRDYPSTIYYALRNSKSAWEPFHSEGTVFGSINRGDLKALRIRWVPSNSIGQLEALLAVLDSEIESLLRQIDTLQSLRDSLLHGLLSGRIRVGEAAT